MNQPDPVDLLFGGLEKLGPGDDKETLRALDRLPRKSFDLVVDVGCGNGRQTLALARALGGRIHAVDSRQPFLEELSRRAEAAGVAPSIETHCMDMKDVPSVFHDIDLLWCEGAAYNIGFANALSVWAPAIRPGGFAVVSELTWVRDEVPNAARQFFATAYPAMQTNAENIAAAESAGYTLLDAYTLPEQAWVDGYYDALEPRAKALAEHDNEDVRNFAAETLDEIDIFRRSDGSYGYVLYILQRN